MNLKLTAALFCIPAMLSHCVLAHATSELPNLPSTPNPISLEQSSDAQADQQQRSRIDQVIKQIIENMPSRGYLPPPGDHGMLFALIVQSENWPANTVLALHDQDGDQLATYIKGNNIGETDHTIYIKQLSNGEYTNDPNDALGASNPENLFELILAGQPKGSQLGLGGDFVGGTTTAGRIAHLRDEIADLAKKHRTQLFDAMLHETDSKSAPDVMGTVNPFLPYTIKPTTSALIRDLHRDTPSLTTSRLATLLQTAPLSDTEQHSYFSTGVLPQSFITARLALETTAKQEQALDAVYHTRTFNPQSDNLIRQVATDELSALGHNLTIITPQQHIDLDAAQRGAIILRDYGQGHYEAFSLINDEFISVDRNTDSFFNAIASVLQPHEHRALNMNDDRDIVGIRTHFGKAAEQKTALSPGPSSQTEGPETNAFDYGENLANGSPHKVLNNHDGEHDHWNAIGRVNACTGTVLDTRSAASNAQSPAYVLTAGHCMSGANGEVIVGNPVSASIALNYFADTQGQRKTYEIAEISYSTLTVRDIAILRLTAPLEQLIADGIRPLRLADAPLAIGSDVLNVGAPTGARVQTLNLAACKLGDGGTKIEGDWVWRHLTMNQCEGVKPGSSGSPMIDRFSNRIVALVNTSTASQHPSVGSHPRGYPAWEKNSNYGNEVTFLNRCFVDSVFNAKAASCELSPLFSVTLPNFPPPPRHTRRTRDAQGELVYPSWDLKFGISSNFYRFKTAIDADECEKPMGYSAAQASDNAHIDAQVEPQVGIQILCIVGVDAADMALDSSSVRNALSLAMQLHEQSETPAPEMEITKESSGKYVVNWLLTNPLIAHYKIKYGAPEKVDCNDPAGYRLNGIFTRAIPTKMLPLKMCTITSDVTKQQSSPREDAMY